MRAVLNIILILLIGCQNSNTKVQEVENKPYIDLKNVSYIKLINENDTLEIKDTNAINKIVSNINNSKIEYLKFGSSQKIIFYNSQNINIEEGFYRDNLIKIKGVVYRLNEEIK